MKDLTHLPTPILAHRPHWVDLYWRAWAAFLPSPDWDPAHLARNLIVPDGDADTLDQNEAAQVQLDAWCATFPLPHTPPPELAPRLTTLLLSQIIGIQLHKNDATGGNVRQISWRLRDPPPVGIHNLPWDDYTISLLADHPRGGGLVVQVDSPVDLLLEIVTPHTTFMELVAPGPHTLTLTVLDRTDVQANPPDQK